MLLQKLRLPSGLVLLAFLATHLINHAAGLISLDAMERGLGLFILVWEKQPGLTVLAAAFLIHLANALVSIWQRHSFRLKSWQAVQLGLGLAVPLLLAAHVFGTVVAFERFGVGTPYRYVLSAMWGGNGLVALQQTVLVLVAWVHGCIGVHYWLRLKPWYPKALPYLYAAALLIPALGLAGFVSTGLQVRALAMQPGWLEELHRSIKLTPEAQAFAAQGALWTRITIVGLVLAAFAGPALRAVRARRGGPKLYYRDTRVLDIIPGATALEIIRAAGIPQAMVCGGRGRCSTCRVRVGMGAEQLPPPGLDEARVLQRIGAPEGVRLACQIRPVADLEVTPLLPPTATARDGFQGPGHRHGQEREVAVLFADLRGFTRLSEHRLPYDVVFLLNRYFAAMGQAIEAAGGRVDKFIGDGVMALFGVEAGRDAGSRQALDAARRMAARLAELNEALASDLKEPLRMGIGLHVGPAIVGEMGYGGVKGLTAVGDTVNTASRLEGLCKGYAAELVVSQDLLDHAGVDLSAFRAERVVIRGRREPLCVRVVTRIADLPG
ncbi:adenylate/guanylate cyclase domain-containing protein [Inquilinus limosus]|uniref:adenylate/guanylate cyclase domain-containing protein n=1 Tax=Inquilinus limosus TaxID=171674 RepID=UPI003F16ED8C